MLLLNELTAVFSLAGKSTIAALLEKFYDIDSGSITIDGHDIRELDYSWVRGELIGFINQVIRSGRVTSSFCLRVLILSISWL